jgi:hypothetical protein
MVICCENDLFYKYYRIESRLILTLYVKTDKLQLKLVTLSGQEIQARDKEVISAMHRQTTAAS